VTIFFSNGQLRLSPIFYTIYQFSHANEIQLPDAISHKSGHYIYIHIRRPHTFCELNLCFTHYYADWIRWRYSYIVFQ